MTVQDVSELFKISWGTVKNIDKEYLQKHYSKPVLKNVEIIAGDEILNCYICQNNCQDIQIHNLIWNRKKDRNKYIHDISNYL